MNWDRIEGNWKQMTGKVRQQWGKLTDDDLTKIDGRREELAGRIQEVYGISKDEAENQIERFSGSLDTGSLNAGTHDMGESGNTTGRTRGADRSRN